MELKIIGREVEEKYRCDFNNDLISFMLMCYITLVGQMRKTVIILTGAETGF